MKLLSYHIGNYGKIHNQDGDFAGGITCFCEKNGFGKSTLASFIKAMFYGLPSYTVASKGFNDRQHFYPFGGGKFGGSLTFESGGKIYRIERFFDKKSSKGDECKVYQNGTLFDGFGEEIGKMLFGLDEESFKKTVFITADEIEISSTHSINEKLNRTVESVGETDNFETAIGTLDKAKKALKAARGNNDKISNKKAEIGELAAQIKNLKDMSDELAPAYVERERLTGEIAFLEREIKTAGEQGLILQKWETLDATSLQIEGKKRELQRLKEKYPLGVPNDAERAQLQECLQKTNLLQGSLQASVFHKEKEVSLRALEEKFASGVPMDESISKKQEKISRLTALEAEKKRILERERTEREKQLQRKFSFGVPSEAELKEGRLLAEEYKRKENELKTLSEAVLKTVQPQAKAKKKANKLAVAWFVIGAALLFAGLGLLFVIQALGFGLTIGGVCLLVAAAFVQFKTSVNATLPPSNAQFDVASVQAECKLLEEKLRAFTVPYGYYGEAGALYDFSLLEEDVKAYHALLSLETERNATLERLKKEETELRAELVAFLQAYGENAESLQNGLSRLTGAIASYRAMQLDKKAAQARTMELQEALELAQKHILSILEKYGLDMSVATMDGLKALELDARASVSLAFDIKKLEKDLFDYKERNGLTVRPEGEKADVNTLRAQLSAAQSELAKLDKNIAETERFVEKLPEKESALSLAEEKLKEYKERHELLVDTMQALKSAEQVLKDKYVAPIKERFSVYAEALERVLDEKVGMDQDFRIVFERGGEARSDKHLSAGERSLCGLCLRLALIDNMYEVEKPFIVMDDPFVHLDETHMTRTKALVSELAKDKQILYFCCHESRRI